MSQADMNTELDISNLCEFDDVRIYEVGIRLDAAFEEDGDLQLIADSDSTGFEDDVDESSYNEEAHDWELHVTVQPCKVEFRARLLIRDRAARYLVDAGIRYKGPHELNEMPQRIIFRFIETTAFPTLLPFIRSEVHQGAAKLGADHKVFRSPSSGWVREVLAKALQRNASGKHEEQNSNAQTGQPAVD
jgi:hypothetical protein